MCRAMRWTWRDYIDAPQYVIDVLIEKLEQESNEREDT